MDWSVLISVTALVISVLCPVLTALVNNLFQLKFRNRDFFNKHRAEVIEGYLRTAGACTCNDSKEARSEYGKYYAEIFLYAPEPIWGDLELFHEMITSGSAKGTYAQLIKISKVLSKNPPRTPWSKNRNRNRNV